MFDTLLAQTFHGSTFTQRLKFQKKQIQAMTNPTKTPLLTKAFEDIFGHFFATSQKPLTS